MTAEQKKNIALFLDLAGDFLRDGYKQPREEYPFVDDEQRVSAEISEPSPSRGTAATETEPSSMGIGQSIRQGLPIEEDSLESIATKIRSCTRCSLSLTRTLAVPGEGVSRPLVLVLGEGPGVEEDASGRPFVGKAGQLLDRMLAAVGLSRDRNCFILNVVKCRPPHNRDPLPEEIAPCAGFLVRQMRLLKPLVLFSVGRIAAQTLLNTTEGIGRLRGKFTQYREIPLLPSYHPSALLRDESLKRPAWEDLKTLRGKLAELDASYAKETNMPSSDPILSVSGDTPETTSSVVAPVSYLDLVFDIPLNQVFTYRIDPKAQGCIGKRVIASLGSRESIGYIIGERAAAPQGIDEAHIKGVQRIVDKEPIFENRDIRLAEWMAAYYLCSLGQALAMMIPSGQWTGTYSTFSDDDIITGHVSELSEEQQKALEAIIAPQEQIVPLPSSPQVLPILFYLYGITGSGKTEVFLRAAEFMLSTGKSIIYLVPAISLTHQTVEAIKMRFGSVAAALHSGLSLEARFTEWIRIKRGDAHIVVGPRSAVFAPVQNLGLIIIDEEHDGSYKSENTPRYHARQVAMRRCSVEKARLVMGSATPSMEAWKLMGEGAIKRLDLTRRLSGGSIPEITSVSLEQTEGCLTRELKAEIRKTARMGRQTILFLNRRGFSRFYHCRACGYELICHQCSVSLTYHKSRDRAICHYCGYQTIPPRVCPQCGSLAAGYSSFGTEMIEEDVRQTFPDLQIRRADADTTSRKGSLQETLEIFKAGGFDILLGTQMVAKGLNFPGVRLVGVVLADTGLHIPDFRATERTFSLIVQVAGRSGRYFPDGKVIVQTLRPHDPVITLACALDVKGFFDMELAQRKILGFPPYSRLIRFTIRSKEAERADTAINRLTSITAALLPYDANILGPAECPIGIIAGNHRRQLLLRGVSMGALHAAARTILNQYEKGRDSQVYLEVDVDPVSLM